jgi:hypothetical protein
MKHDSSKEHVFCAAHWAARLREMRIISAQNQNAGGGRIKQVCAGREMTADFRGGVASGAATTIGAVITVGTLKPMCAAEQMEQS